MSAQRATGFTIAVLLATAGLCLSAYTIRAVGESDRIHRGRLRTLGELSALREKAAETRSALRLFETLAHAPVDLAAAATRVIPDAKPVFGEAKDRELAGGWVLREVTVSIADAPASEAGRLVEYLENQQPPWRLTAFAFTATTSGRGAAKLTLQTIVRAARP